MGDDGRSYLSTRFISNPARSPGNSMICLQKFCCTIQVIDVYPIKTKYISTYLGIIQLLLNTVLSSWPVVASSIGVFSSFLKMIEFHYSTWTAQLDLTEVKT